MYHIGGNTYELVKENKNGWNFEAFRDRYSDVLDRYDYIVGDWGYNQLRLKGFFRENNAKNNKESSIAVLQDYLNEYCNFGCAYFIVEKQNVKNQRGQNGSGSDKDAVSDTPEGNETANSSMNPKEGREPSVMKGQENGPVIQGQQPREHQRREKSGNKPEAKEGRHGGRHSDQKDAAKEQGGNSKAGHKYRDSGNGNGNNNGNFPKGSPRKEKPKDKHKEKEREKSEPAV